jgi:hypothetical protein
MAFTQKSRGRGIRGALLVAMCLCSLWTLGLRWWGHGRLKASLLPLAGKWGRSQGGPRGWSRPVCAEIAMCKVFDPFPVQNSELKERKIDVTFFCLFEPLFLNMP